MALDSRSLLQILAVSKGNIDSNKYFDVLENNQTDGELRF